MTPLSNSHIKDKRHRLLLECKFRLIFINTIKSVSAI